MWYVWNGLGGEESLIEGVGSWWDRRVCLQFAAVLGVPVKSLSFPLELFVPGCPTTLLLSYSRSHHYGIFSLTLHGEGGCGEDGFGYGCLTLKLSDRHFTWKDRSWGLERVIDSKEAERLLDEIFARALGRR